MKTNHNQVAVHIRRALAECREDYVLSEARQLLNAALASVEKVAKKRGRNEASATATAKYAEEAKKKNEEWMKMIMDGLKINNEETDDTK